MIYREGTVTVSGSTAVVVGAGTQWRETVRAGDFFAVQGYMITVQVAEVIDDTHLRLARLVPKFPAGTYGGLSYVISREFTANYDLPMPQDGDIEASELINRALKIIDTNMPS